MLILQRKEKNLSTTLRFFAALRMKLWGRPRFPDPDLLTHRQISGPRTAATSA